MTYELIDIKTPSEGRKMVHKRRYPFVMNQKVIIKPQHQEILPTKVFFWKNLEGHTGMIIPDEDLENKTELRLSSSVVTVGKDNIVPILAINLNDHAITFTENKQVAVFQFLSPQEEEELIEIGPDILALDRMKNGEFFRGINQLMRVGKTRGGRLRKRPPLDYEKIWFPTPETCRNPDNLPSLQGKFFDNIADLQKSDLLDPQNNKQDKKTFLAQFDW